VEADLLRHADHTLLSGAHTQALRIYLRSIALKPLSRKAWMKLFRWVVFVTFPPLRSIAFQGGFGNRL
jgi:hypothetical protein